MDRGGRKPREMERPRNSRDGDKSDLERSVHKSWWAPTLMKNYVAFIFIISVLMIRGPCTESQLLHGELHDVVLQRAAKK